MSTPALALVPVLPASTGTGANIGQQLTCCWTADVSSRGCA